MPPTNIDLPGTWEPPLYQIDLSLPPHLRHREICRAFSREINELTSLYDELLGITPFPRVLKFLAKRLLRRVYSNEETEEIRGISEESGVGIHLVVAYNTFLDLFSGCISGGTNVDMGDGEERMLHFRGLDWEMDQLRGMIIRVEYVRDAVVVARAVTYAGYVGVLTGVRQGLSISFNYRVRLCSTSSAFAHRIHQLLLLLGHRPSIPSILRHILLSPTPPPPLSDLSESLLLKPTSPGYVTFCTPSDILVIEKDLKTATVQTSSEFLAVTNHDLHMEAWTHDQWVAALNKDGLPGVGGIRDILEESVARKELVVKMWRTKTGANRGPAERTKVVRVRDVKKWLTSEPISNDLTHFSCIMDPGVEGGGIVWARAYDHPGRDRN